jgi:plastocyanin
VTASEFKFSPATIQVPVGKKITVTLFNNGTVEHDITLDAFGLKI